MKVAANDLGPVMTQAVLPPRSGHRSGVIRCPERLGAVQGLVAPGMAGINISVGVAIRPGREGLGR